MTNKIFLIFIPLWILELQIRVYKLVTKMVTVMMMAAIIHNGDYKPDSVLCIYTLTHLILSNL